MIHDEDRLQSQNGDDRRHLRLVNEPAKKKNVSPLSDESPTELRSLIRSMQKKEPSERSKAFDDDLPPAA